MLLNGPYSDLERRVLETFQSFVVSNQSVPLPPVVILPDTMSLLVRRLADDGLVTIHHRDLGYSTSFTDGLVVKNGVLLIALSREGRTFIENLAAVVQ